MPRLKNRLGFALPMAILVTAVLTAALAAGFAAASAERSANTARRGESRAYAIAVNGLENFLIRRATLCTQAGSVCVDDPSAAGSDTERVRVTVPGGYAEVLSVKVRPATGTTGTQQAMFFVRSKGVDTSRLRIAGAVGDSAERIVGVYALWQVNTVNVMSSWTSLNPFQKQGTSGVITGVNECNPSDTIAGLVVPKGAYSNNGSWVPQGDPPLDTSSTFNQLKQTIGIDWSSVVAGGIPADIEIPPASFPSSSWFSADTTRWPVIHIHSNNYSLPAKGRGMIIADSNFIINGSEMWDGVILVGGKLTSNGSNTVAGATMSGLNRLLGGMTDTSVVYDDPSVANGNKIYQYNSCKVARASQNLRAYKTLPNTWVDNLPAW